MVTGGSGKADGDPGALGAWLRVAQRINVYRLPPPGPLCPYLEADLAELGQSFVILTWTGAVVYLGVILIPATGPRARHFGTTP